MASNTRRAIPLALLVLLLLGTLAAAIAGQVSSPSGTTSAPSTSSAAKWVSNLLMTTARARTAHLAYAHVTASPNPILRGTITGSGAVNFGAGTVRVNEVEQQVEVVPRSGLFQPHSGQQPPQNVIEPARSIERPSRNAISMIGIGKTAYQSMNVLNGAWLRMTIARDPRAQLGLEYAANASVALGGLEGLEPIAAVQTLGPAELDGVATTRYLVTNTPALCGRSSNAADVQTQGPTTVWVDHDGRLVQARWTVSTSGTVPPAPSAVFGLGPTKTTATLTFSRFGAPVTITAPRRIINPGGSSKSFIIRSRCTGTM